MKTAKLIIGIISMVLFFVIVFQSCAAGAVNILEQNSTDSTGSAGILVALIFLIAGIVGAVTRKSEGGGITAGVFYLIAAIVGITNEGTYGDLIVWGILAAAFGAIFIGGSIGLSKEQERKDE